MNFDDAAMRLVELAASRHNAFHTTEAAEQGFTADRLRRARARGELLELRPKVWAVVGGRRSSHQALRAAVLGLAGSAAGYRSAAWLHGWTSTPPTVPQVWAGGTSRCRLPGATVRRFAKIEPALDVIEVDAITCLNKAATLCTVGAHGDLRFVEECLDVFLRSESTAWLDRTLSRMWTPHAAGPRLLAAVMQDPRRVQGVTDSWMERVVVQLVATPWMPPVCLQQPVAVDGRTFLIDIAIPELMLGIEAHGRSFHWGPGKQDADNVRDLAISGAGWQLLYVTWAQLQDPAGFVDSLAAVAQARAAQLGVSLPGRVSEPVDMPRF